MTRLTTTYYYLPRATCHSPLATYHLPLATCHLPLTTCHLPLVTTCNYLPTYQERALLWLHLLWLYLLLPTYHVLPTYQERARSYAELRNAAPLEVVVLGGGPIGMRAAVEMALLGHKVYLLWYTCYGAAGAQGILTMAILAMALLGQKMIYYLLESRYLLYNLLSQLTTFFLLRTPYFLLLTATYSLRTR